MALKPSSSSNLGQLALKGLTYLPKNKASRNLDHAHLGAVIKGLVTAGGKTHPAVGKQGASHLYLGGGSSNSLAPALGKGREFAGYVSGYPAVTIYPARSGQLPGCPDNHPRTIPSILTPLLLSGDGHFGQLIWAVSVFFLHFLF